MSERHYLLSRARIRGNVADWSRVGHRIVSIKEPFAKLPTVTDVAKVAHNCIPFPS